MAANNAAILHPQKSSNPLPARFYLVLLVIAIPLLYGHSLRYPLVFDDLPFFVDPLLRQLGSSSFHLDLRWLLYASFGWTYNLFGQDWFWYRLVNVALHSVTTILLFIFFSRVLDAVLPKQGIAPQPRWLPFFAALIFALHPVAVYGVAYLVQRSILMATLFGIAALLCYLEGFIKGKTRWFVISAIFYFLAVFSKEHSIMIPGVATALTLLLHKPSMALIKRVCLPFTLYSMIGLFVILRTKGLLGAAYEPHAAEILAQMSEHQQDIDVDHAYPLSVITQGYLFFKYLLLWIIPYSGWMSIDIRQPFATHFLSWPQFPGFMLFLAYPVLAMKLLLKGGRPGLLGFGMLFPWVLYLTEISTVRIQEPFVLYRSYLWMSGLPFVLFGLIGTSTRKYVAVLVVACMVLASLAWNRLDTFSDNIKTWSDAISKYQGNNLLYVARGYYNRGSAYAAAGRVTEAFADYDKTLELDPKYASAYFNRGNLHLNLNQFNEALENYNATINLKPKHAKAYGNRGLILAKTGRYNESLNDFDRAIQLDPEHAYYYSNRANVHLILARQKEAQDDYLQALSLYDKALESDANNSAVLLNRGRALNMLDRKSEALESFRKSCEAGNPEGCKQIPQT